MPFEPICPHTTKSACINFRAALHSAPSSLPVHSACDCIHFRPIIRPHTDVTLGHCSYLNTCYSEPTYSLSPSILPPSSSGSHSRSGAPNANSPASLPSGLGAGGRGKERAPCRYLHFEVDWDEADENQAASAAISAYKKVNAKKEPKKPVKLGIYQGPSGKVAELVRVLFSRFTTNF
jgi:mRNA (2'-O-methyladenosine-N6-)-methyltransferase